MEDDWVAKQMDCDDFNRLMKLGLLLGIGMGIGMGIRLPLVRLELV